MLNAYLHYFTVKRDICDFTRPHVSDVWRSITAIIFFICKSSLDKRKHCMNFSRCLLGIVIMLLKLRIVRFECM